MAQAFSVRAWDLDVQRGPDWLFVHPRRLARGATLTSDLGEQVWSLLEQNFANRLVLEMDELGPLTSALVGQLVSLEKRIHSRDGMLRLCGLTAENLEVLKRCSLSGYLPLYRDREDAVMGCARPNHPR